MDPLLYMCEKMGNSLLHVAEHEKMKCREAAKQDDSIESSPNAKTTEVDGNTPNEFWILSLMNCNCAPWIRKSLSSPAEQCTAVSESWPKRS